MDRALSNRMIWIVLLSVVFVATEGCKQGLRRKKRDIDENEVKAEMSDFFTTCLEPVASQLFPSTRSAVDFSIRDTKWYQEVKNNVCLESNGRNNSECWISSLMFLLNTRSPLFTPTAQCICDYVEDCPEGPGEEEGSVLNVPGKRSVESYDINLFDEDEYSMYQKRCRLTELDRKFMGCIVERTETERENYPSLENIDGETIATFLKGHFTFCRSHILPEKFRYQTRVSFGLLELKKVCPREGPGTEWRDHLLDILPDALRSGGPVQDAYLQCKAVVDEIGATAFVGRPCDDEYQACTMQHCIWKSMRDVHCRMTCGTCHPEPPPQ